MRIVDTSWENDGRLEERQPMREEPSIHRKFGNLGLTEAAVISFANQWGPLTDSHGVFEDEELPKTNAGDDDEEDDDEFEESDDLNFSTTYDSTDLWFSKIRRMKELMRLWDVVKTGHEKNLSEIIEFAQVGDTEEKFCSRFTIRFKDDPSLWWNFDFRPREVLNFSAYLRRGGLIALAQRCIFDLINESLWGKSSTGVAVREGSQNFVLLFCPHNLEAAMWLSFVQEIVGETTLKQCGFCKTYFEIPKDQNRRRQRSDKQFCSPKCRAAAFRERREKRAAGDAKAGEKEGTDQ